MVTDTLKLNPRFEAASLLQSVTSGKLMSGKAVDCLNDVPYINRRDCSLAVNILLGTIQNQRLLDYLLEVFSGRNTIRFDSFTRAVLETGLYQIAFMDRIPFSAAVNESVQIIKRTNSKAAGLVNAVLRKASAEFEKHADKSELIRAMALNPEILYSVSDEFYSYLEKHYGSAFANDFFKASFDSLFTDIRVNTLKVSVNEYASFLENNGFSYKKSSLSTGIIRIFDTKVSSFPGFSDGLFFVQDEAASTVSAIAGLEKGMKILDCCASPGGKSFSSALLLNDEGSILSCDINSKKVSVIEEGASRLGISSVKTAVMNATEFNKELDREYDVVICDVPCSGFGVIRKKPEVKYKSFQEIERLPAIQLSILKNVSKYIKPGGVIIYSTCTVIREENEAVVESFLDCEKGFRAEEFEIGNVRAEKGTHTFWPNIENTDGFFVAKIRRIE